MDLFSAALRPFCWVSRATLVSCSLVGALACVSPVGEDEASNDRKRTSGGTGGTSGEAGASGVGSGGEGGVGASSGKAGGSGKAGNASMGGNAASGGSGETGGTGATGGTGETGGSGEVAGQGGEPGTAGQSGAGGETGTAGQGGAAGSTSTGQSGAGGAGGSPPVNDCPRVRVVNADPYANIRPDASTSGTPVGKANTGDILDCLGKVQGQAVDGNPLWYNVKTPAVTGFISGTLATCTQDK